MKCEWAMRNRYFLMRHGESLANLSGKIMSLPANGLDGFGLSQAGRQQAARSARASRLSADTLVLASDFLRTRQTSEVAAQTLGTAPPRFHSGLRERAFGELEGLSAERYHEIWAHDERDPRHTALGVESPVALVERLSQVLSELERDYSGRDILLVSHGDPLRFLQLFTAGRPLTEHLKIRLFAPAEIRPLHHLPPC